MAYKKFKKNYKKGKGYRKRKVLTLSNRQASTKAYDSRIEKVMARVARQEDKKNQIRLQYRQYLFGPYNMATNVFTGSTPVHYTGVIQALARIQKLDNSTAVAQVPIAQPFQTPATFVNPGANVIAPVTPRDGFRIGELIRVHGISFNMRVWAKYLYPPIAPGPTYESCMVYWKIVACVYEGSEFANSAPTPEEMLSIPRFGYSAQLDSEADLQSSMMRKKTLMQGKVRMSLSETRADVKFVNRYLDLSAKPLKIEYLLADQIGCEVLKWKPFLVIRSDIPDALPIYQPGVQCCVKLHYTDA